MQKNCLKAVIFAAMLVCAQCAQAEYFGLMNGRTADLRDMSDMSVDVGIMNGDFFDADYDLIGARFNYRLVPGLIGYAGLGLTDIDQFDGTSIGFGIYYQLQDLIASLDSSIKASYHTLDVSRSGFRDVDLSGISVELLVSGKEPISDNGLSWYASAGIHRLSRKTSGFSGDTDTEPGFGGGILLPVGPGTVFAGLEHIDEVVLGVGFRFDIN